MEPEMTDAVVESMSDEESAGVPDVAAPMFVSRQQNKRRMHPAYQEYMQTNNTHSNRGNRMNEFPSIICLNVGGFRYMTRLSTLCKHQDTMLAAMFSGRHQLDKDAQGCYFIDSNGASFGHILDFLRHGTVPPNAMALDVYKDACYYGITPLIDKLQKSPEVARKLVNEAHRAQFPNYEDVKENIIKFAIENATVNRIGEVLIYAFRKEFKAKAPYFNPEHDCISETAHVSVGPWEAPSDEETLIKSLEQDLTDDGFHIKQHEQKKRCKYYNGQNCQKAVYRITVIF